MLFSGAPVQVGRPLIENSLPKGFVGFEWSVFSLSPAEEANGQTAVQGLRFSADDLYDLL